jgi:hypothetical protein
MFMYTAPTPTAPETLAALHAQDALQFRNNLLELVDLGMELARITVQQAKARVEAANAEPDAAPSAELNASYANVTRSIRRSMLLAQKFTEPAKAPAAEDAAQKRIAVRKQIIRRVEDCIHREAKAAEAGDLHAELIERIEAPEFDDEIAQRPVEEIITEIRADLGLGAAEGRNQRKRRTPQDIAILYERAAIPCRAAASNRQETSADPPLAGAEDEEPPWRYIPGLRRP